MSPAKFKAGFAHDVSDAEAAFLRDSQVPINMSAFESRLTNAAWRTRPSWAVIATEDRAFDQAMLLHMAKRIGARITTDGPATRSSSRRPESLPTPSSRPHRGPPG